MHILIGIPSTEYVQHQFALQNLPEILLYSSRVLPNCKLSVMNAQGNRTDLNRNRILTHALKDSSINYILWLDADMLYPVNIVELYVSVLKLNVPVDILGCLYFRRGYPFDAVAYEKLHNQERQYKPMLPPAFSEDKLYEVDAVGYGGMLVNMKAYEALGEKKWTTYGKNYHIPDATKDNLTHDILFCEDAKAAGLTVKLHGGVRPAHLCTKAVTIEDWRKTAYEDFEFRQEPPLVLVVMPAIDPLQAQKAANVMGQRAGVKCRVEIILDDQKMGFVSIVNQAAEALKPELVVYTAQDAIVGENWLKHALMTMLINNAGLVGFHDGKRAGRLASFGLVNCNWVKKIYNGNIFYPGYKSHYADTELTQIAKQQNKYAYAERAVMLENDLDKPLGLGKPPSDEDKRLYNERKIAGFGGIVTDASLLQEFA